MPGSPAGPSHRITWIQEQLVAQQGHLDEQAPDPDSEVRLGWNANRQLAVVFYLARSRAGALTHERGEALARAVHRLGQHPPATVLWYFNSAGADFHAPLQGLLGLHRLSQSWQAFRQQHPSLVITLCDQWLYGGAAMLASTLSDEIWLTDTASLGLFGYRANPKQTNLQGRSALPPEQPQLLPGLRLWRPTESALNQALQALIATGRLNAS